ncbi:hypothetical protein ANN_21220 [Periplaneta americana]|uniref:Uncharacterized protein n=1 Tax=Periplaneta americana TaxID=6978 RepID=A0ABQ8SEQ4_PERAM|nr:hypothetical protein ANN_21220 [Periplaneta americana]
MLRVSGVQSMSEIEIKVSEVVQEWQKKPDRPLELISETCSLQSTIDWSPDLTPCDFYLWYIKDRIYVPPLPQTLVQLRERINNAVMTIDRTTLHNVWNELDYAWTYVVSPEGHT